MTAGNTSCSNIYTRNVCATGGGVSTIVPLPSWQNGIAGMLTSGRKQPDISLPFFPVAVYTGGSWGEYLGTSWSSLANNIGYSCNASQYNQVAGIGVPKGWALANAL